MGVITSGGDAIHAAGCVRFVCFLSFGFGWELLCAAAVSPWRTAMAALSAWLSSLVDGCIGLSLPLSPPEMQRPRSVDLAPSSVELFFDAGRWTLL